MQSIIASPQQGRSPKRTPAGATYIFLAHKPMVKPPVLAKGTKRALIAQVLADDIASGKYPVGTNLPSEHELALAFGVSRHTIRIALNGLREQGMLESRQGFGNIVRQSTSSARYLQSFASLEDILQYASTTAVEFTGKSEIVVSPDMALWIGCKPGERWWRITTARYLKDRSLPVAATEIFIPYLFGSILNHTEESGGTLLTLIKSLLGKAVQEVHQEIHAAKALPEQAAVLQIPVNDPVLSITRHYFGTDGQVLEVSRSVHTSETFNYSMRMRLSAH